MSTITMHKRHTPFARSQRGATLIELMIGMVIGMLVVMAALSSIIFTRSAARSVSDSALLEQQGTIVMSMIGRQIKQAGAINAIEQGGVGTGAVSFSGAFVGLDAANPGQVRVRGADGTGTGADTLTISYAPANDGIDSNNCVNVGAILYPPGGAATSRQVVSHLSVQTASNSLMCGTGQPGADQPIASNVLDMQVFYLTLVEPDQRIMRQTATQVGNQVTNWQNVSGIEVCLHLASDNAVVSSDTPAYNITNCQGANVVINPGGTAGDRRVHRIVRQTFDLRNTL